jgi:chemotaxis protein CheX
MQNNRPFSFIKGDGYTTLRLIGSLEHEHLAPYEKEIPEHLSDPCPHFVVNCEHLSGLSKGWIRALLKLKGDLKKYNKEIRLILVKNNLAEILHNEGIDTAFKYAPGLREALVDLGLVTKKMLDTDFINPFLNATLNVLKVQAGVDAKPGKIFVKSDQHKNMGDISGVIGLVSDTFNGTVNITFPEKVFLQIVSGMLGEEYTELTKDIVDAAGEITNMIFGQAKVILNEKGYGIKTAIPSVVSGKNHSLEALTKGPVVVVPFESSKGSFFVEICLSA